MPTESPETKTTPETAETLEQRIERLEKENAELRAENEKLKSNADQSNLKEEIVVNRLYRFGKSRLNKAEVDNILNNLNGEHKNKIEDFIKNGKIEDLQKYLNGLIDSGAINKDQLVNNCREKGIWLRGGRIFEDGKFGPQTFEAIKCLSSANDGGEGEKEKEYTEFTLSGKKVKLYKISSVDELSEYKWADPENYDENNKDTYPKAYQLSLNGVTYTFYSNGRCSDGKIMYNTKDVVDKLKNEGGKKGNDEDSKVDKKDENNAEKVENLEKINPKVFESLQNKFRDILGELNVQEYKNAYSSSGKNPKVGFILRTKEKYNGSYKQEQKWINFHDYLSNDVLDKEKLKEDIKRMVDEFEKQAKIENEDSINASKFLADIKNANYSFNDLFGNEKENEYYYTFFNEFPDGKVKLRSSTSFKGDKLEIQLDKGWPNLPGWLSGHSIDKKDLKGKDGKYSLELFKQKMKGIVTKIVNENFK